MKETNTLSLYKYVQALFGDRWIDWGVVVVFFLLIASWFVPESGADFLVDFIAAGVMLAVAVRTGYVIACVRLGSRLQTESSRTARFREMTSNVAAVSFFVIAVLLIIWRCLR